MADSAGLGDVISMALENVINLQQQQQQISSEMMMSTSMETTIVTTSSTSTTTSNTSTVVAEKKKKKSSKKSKKAKQDSSSVQVVQRMPSVNKKIHVRSVDTSQVQQKFNRVMLTNHWL